MSTPSVGLTFDGNDDCCYVSNKFLVGGCFFVLPLCQAGPQCHGADDCCDGQCGEGEGDCDWDSDCYGFLVCGSANCVGQGFEENDDCCEKPQEWSVAGRLAVLTENRITEPQLN